MSVICELEDLRRLYHRRVPKMFQGYCESGSWTQQTLAENTSDFKDIRFRQRVARDLTPRSLKTTMAGHDVNMPLALAPVGLLGMQHADGEIHAARAAEKFGVPFTLSTMSICSMEVVAFDGTTVAHHNIFVWRYALTSRDWRCSFQWVVVVCWP